MTLRVAWRSVAEGLLAGLAVGGATGLGLGLLMSLFAVAAGEAAGAPVVLVAAAVGGLALGGAVGVLCGAGVTLALATTDLVLRLAGRRLSRTGGTAVVPVAVVLTPVVAAAAAWAGDSRMLRSLVLAGLPLLVGAAVATWRYRVLTRPGPLPTDPTSALPGR